MNYNLIAGNFVKGFSRQYLRKQWSKGGRTGGISVGGFGISPSTTLRTSPGGKDLRKYRAMSRHCLLMDTPTAKTHKEICILFPLCALCVFPIGSVFLLRHFDASAGSARRFAQCDATLDGHRLAGKTFCVLCEKFFKPLSSYIFSKKKLDKQFFS